MQSHLNMYKTVKRDICSTDKVYHGEPVRWSVAILKVIVDTCGELLLNMSVELYSFATTFFDCTSEYSLLEAQSNRMDLRCDQGGAEIWEGSIFFIGGAVSYGYM